MWVDVRKDSLEAFRQVFLYLEEKGLWDKENPVHCLCLWLVYHLRIQASLDRAKDAWNHHKIRTANSKAPVAIYELSRQKAINQGYWSGDCGDDVSCVNGYYGVEGATEEGIAMPPVDVDDPNVALNDDEDIAEARALLEGFDFGEDDGNWGIDVYCRVVVELTAIVQAREAS